MRRIAHRRQRLQPARIHRVDRHIRLSGLIRSRPQTRLVLNPVPRKPARKIQHALALVHPLQRLRHLPDRIQLTISIQVHILRIIRRKRARIIARSIRHTPHIAARKRGLIRAVVLPQLRQQHILVTRKILIQIQRGRKAHQRHQIRRLHLLAHIVLRRLHRTIRIVILQRAHVEEHHNQPVVLQLLRVRRKVVLQQVRHTRLATTHRALLRQSSGLIHILVIETRNALRLTILKDLKVVRRKPLHHSARLLIPHHHVRQHDIGVHGQPVVTVLPSLRLLPNSPLLRGGHGAHSKRKAQTSRQPPPHQNHAHQPRYPRVLATSH